MTRSRWNARAGALGTGAFLALLGGCAPSAEESSTLGEYLLQSLAWAKQTADTALIEEIFHPGATYDDYANQVEYRGIDEIVEFVTRVHEWGDDVYLNLGNTMTGDGVAVGEWFFAAVQTRPIPDVLAIRTDREVVLSGVTILQIEGGRIARAADYTDLAALVLQLGGRIEWPDGTVVEGDAPS